MKLMNLVSVIIPAHNEESILKQNIETVRKTLDVLQCPYEIIVIDDGSNDDTFLEIESLNQPPVRVYRKAKTQGKGSAIKTGWKMAKGEYVLVIDADLQIKPHEIKVFLRTMEFYDSDAVIGNKHHPYSIVEYSLARKIVSWTYNTIVHFLFGFSLSDSQCGFKLFKKSALDAVMSRVLVKQFAFDLEVLVALIENKFRISDAPVTVYKSLDAGCVNIYTIFQTLKDTLAVYYRKSIGWYKN